MLKLYFLYCNNYNNLEGQFHFQYRNNPK